MQQLYNNTNIERLYNENNNLEHNEGFYYLHELEVCHQIKSMVSLLPCATTRNQGDFKKLLRLHQEPPIHRTERGINMVPNVAKMNTDKRFLNPNIT